ncbi:hypothetical protein [Christiangramia forsetii]|uniref:Uncharacterized protein n=2 Tax=Christiangramia forsetii TaxID=411153 RepID=A0M546_CHRFK|nr:hypothetical protein [Christiangramia forsetii]GGG21876.1 hypothetical protein GCM10011532_01130 [Christiangramia forsetii]CAL67741.1 hypothetical protein GFO_2787 [Christiangramia forsetii KT0803]
MAPIKFEEHIKEKLDQREIQPSAGSWKKLNAQLDNSNKGSGKKWWLSAVAAVAVLLIASVLFVNQQNQISTPIVETPSENYDKSDNVQFEQPVELASEESKEDVESAIQLPAETPAEERTSKDQVSENNGGENLASNTLEDKKSIEPIGMKPSILKTQNNIQVSEELEGILAKVSEMEKVNGKVSDAEVDALLAEAAAEISKEQNLYIENTISAEALLADVEYEVDQSFRKEVFDFLKEEFLKAKTAVATRND